MLHFSMVRAKTGAKYYSASEGNYYEENKDHCKWFGKGSKKLGLKGRIRTDQFVNALNGKGPKGIPLRYSLGHGQSRAGLDLTFSAPKSVGIAALVGGDTRLIDAHQNAVKEALRVVEDRYAQTRICNQRTQTDNITVAMWLHKENRNLDPQLHTHAVLLNTTQGPDGKWRSITTEGIYHHRNVLSRIYANELARQVQLLGYEIKPDAHGHGGWDIKGYRQSDLKLFSSRSNEVEQYCKEHGITDAEGKRKAALLTRDTKRKNIDPDTLQKEWRRKARESNIIHPIPREYELKREPLNELINKAIGHCEERRAVFTRERLEEFIFYSPSGYGLGEVTRAIDERTEMLRVGNQFSTEYAINRERETVGLMEEGSQAFSALPEADDLGGLTRSQREAVVMASRSTERVMGWQGVPGAGKTHTLKRLVEHQESHGINVRGFTPSAEAAKVLATEAGISADTLASVLINPPEVKGRELWVIDEAGMASAEQIHKLLKIAKEKAIQVLLVGDTKQLSSIEAGAPFRSLQQHGMSVAMLSDFMRQKDERLAKAVEIAYHGDVYDAIALLNNQGLIQEKRLSERAILIAEKYCALSDVERDKTLLIAGTHQEREVITAEIRSRMLGDNPSISMRRLKSKDLTQEQRKDARFYSEGDVIRFRSGVLNNQRGQVVGIDQDYLLVSSKRKTYRINPRDVRTEVYQPIGIDVAIGDRLKWTRNDSKLKRRNGQMMTVVDVNEKSITVRYDSGKSEDIHVRQWQHLDHAWVSTVHSAQGKTAERVWVSAGTDLTLSKESILVGLSRAKQELEIFAEDVGMYLELSKESSRQLNPSDILKSERPIQIQKKDLSIGHLEPKHRAELEASGIHADIIALNFESLSGDRAIEFVCSEALGQIGGHGDQYATGPVRKILDRYAHLSEGGWWCNGGIDPLTWENKLWGCFKPDSPRMDTEKDKVIKYEHPPKTERSIFLLEPGATIASAIFKANGVRPEPGESFWQTVARTNIPIEITEGAKKSAALLSQGIATIGLPGIYAGYHSQDNGMPISPKLHRELAIFCTPGREITISFDNDKKPKTKRNVAIASYRMSLLMKLQGCKTFKRIWSQEKGIDDLIVRHGNQWRERTLIESIRAKTNKKAPSQQLEA